MVKKKVGGAKRYAKHAAAAAAGGAAGEGGPKWKGPAPPKHLQRKITKKVGFLEKVAAANSAKLGVQKGSGVGKRKGGAKGSTALHNLSSLTGVLDEVHRDVQEAAAGKQKHKQHGAKVFGQGVHSSRARSSIQAAETARMQQVLHHPVFKSNPIAAITNHLKNTLPPPPAAPAAPRSKQDRKKAAKQRKQQQAASMEAD